MQTVPSITGVQLQPYSLTFLRPWVSGSATQSQIQGYPTPPMQQRQGWLIKVSLDTNNGGMGCPHISDGGRYPHIAHAGWGDCAPLPMMGTVTMATAAVALQTLANELIGYTPQAALKHLDRSSCPHVVRFGVETALLDLLAHHAGLPLANWLQSTANPIIPVNAIIGTIGASSIKHAASAIQTGYRVLKLKVGVRAWCEELPHLHALLATLPNHVQLRLDANGTWPRELAADILTSLIGLPIEAVEEPVANATYEILAALQNLVPFALALDEGLAAMLPNSPLTEFPVRRLVLKPALCGGLRRTFNLAQQAQAQGLEVVITSMLESAVGVQAAAHLAAAVGGGLAHGLATSDWFVRNVSAAPIVTDGYYRLEFKPGLGIVPDHSDQANTF